MSGGSDAFRARRVESLALRVWDVVQWSLVSAFCLQRSVQIYFMGLHSDKGFGCDPHHHAPNSWRPPGILDEPGWIWVNLGDYLGVLYVTHRSFVPSYYVPRRTFLYIFIGNRVTHISHKLFRYRGLVYCNRCGSRSVHKLYKLGDPCEPATGYGKTNLDRIRLGLLPYNLNKWPEDDQ